MTPKFSNLEEQLYQWINALRKVGIPVTPSLAILKSKEISKQLQIPPDEFKAFWK